MKAPKPLIFYLIAWFVVWLFNTATSMIDLDGTIMAFMEQIEATDVELSLEQAKSILIGTTLVISIIQLTFVFALYKGVKVVRLLDLAFKILGLPFTLLGLWSFGSFSLLEQVQSLLTIGITAGGIFVLFMPEVKAYFLYDSSVEQSESTEASIESIEEKID